MGTDNRSLAIKLNMAKAYDKVEWPFLMAMLKALGFCDLFCSLVFECISTVSYSILLNGEAAGHIIHTHGLWQGDPLSPFLFLICVEGLSTLICYNEERHSMNGFQFHPSGMRITHLFFADDSVLFCKAEEQEVRNMKSILDCYERGSGQAINYDKSSIFFSHNCPMRTRRQVVDILKVQQKDGFGRYLGLTADFGASKRAVFDEV
ncbi:hypothetical protein L3X38_032943 [Prunus dulcis]|uniref:Reverse transcriptase domain-containing protein n=1 Tax=Prunus dulcis TaxID=3755 RepID=A0AAD4VF18_PRUDU|nr:hypothetical protein L3X38_032943 [Prunus dulcis]